MSTDIRLDQSFLQGRIYHLHDKCLTILVVLLLLLLVVLHLFRLLLLLLLRLLLLLLLRLLLRLLLLLLVGVLVLSGLLAVHVVLVRLHLFRHLLRHLFGVVASLFFLLLTYDKKWRSKSTNHKSNHKEADEYPTHSRSPGTSRGVSDASG